MKIKWNKKPSVYRNGKYFYVTKSPLGTIYWVSQCWTTGKWKVEDSFRRVQFPLSDTPAKARKLVENLIKKTGE